MAVDPPVRRCARGTRRALPLVTTLALLGMALGAAPADLGPGNPLPRNASGITVSASWLDATVPAAALPASDSLSAIAGRVETEVEAAPAVLAAAAGVAQVPDVGQSAAGSVGAGAHLPVGARVALGGDPGCGSPRGPRAPPHRVA